MQRFISIADGGLKLVFGTGQACETVRALDQLYGELGMAEELPDDVMHSVCDPELPDAGQVAWTKF